MFKRLLESVNIRAATTNVEASTDTIETKFVGSVEKLAYVTERCSELVGQLASTLRVVSNNSQDYLSVG